MKRSPSEHYRALRKIDSPDHLDRRILSEARQLAPNMEPAKLSVRFLNWLPITAMACLIGLTVIVIQPGIEQILQKPSDSISDFDPTPPQKAKIQRGTQAPPKINRLNAPASVERMLMEPLSSNPPSLAVADSAVQQKRVEIQTSTVGSGFAASREGAKENLFFVNQKQKAFDHIEVLLKNNEFRFAVGVINELRKTCSECELPESFLTMHNERE
ncbi:MAG: hypothetical protein GKR96_05225 [Gammaproteobacteria bacterium]|nr:hypothetical protein [Gammaproteobacteria bacterium]